MSIGVKYVGPVLDISGYANACREYIFSLHDKGLPITVKPHCFETNQPLFGTEEQRALLTSLINKDIEYDTVICQLTPDMAIQHKEHGKKNIAYFAWETTYVHHKWVACLNEMDEVWVPCAWNVAALKNSGVTVPVFKIPHGIAVDKFDGDIDTSVLEIPGIDEETFVFYSIFQWNARKNPDGLLRSYFNAFRNNEDVVLVMKAYVGYGGANDRQSIAAHVSQIKTDMGLDSYPRVVLLSTILTDKQIEALHVLGDCFVSLHHAEGFGLTLFDAGLAGNAVIGTGATGNMEFMNRANSYLVDYQWQYVKHMSSFNPWYQGTGVWASPNEVHASEQMLFVYNNRDDVAKRGALLRKQITEGFSWEKVSDMVMTRLFGGDSPGPSICCEVSEKEAEGYKRALIRQHFFKCRGYFPDFEELGPFLNLLEPLEAVLHKIEQGVDEHLLVSTKLPLTLVIIAKNEEDSIEGCIQSVSEFVSEIVVLDTGSTDNTVAVAEKKGARVYSSGFSNFSKLRTLCAHSAKQPAVLMLDCDERLIDAERLAPYVKAIFEGEYEAVALPRARWLDWDRTEQVEPDAGCDWQVRLFKNDPWIGFRRGYPHEEFHGAGVMYFDIDKLPHVAHFCDLFPSKRLARYKQNITIAKDVGPFFYFAELFRQKLFVLLCSQSRYLLEPSPCSLYRLASAAFEEWGSAAGGGGELADLADRLKTELSASKLPYGEGNEFLPILSVLEQLLEWGGISEYYIDESGNIKCS